MKLEDIIKILEESKSNPEAIEFLKTIKQVNKDTVKEYLENNDEGKTFAQSFMDSKITKAIETYKEKTLPSLVETEVAKRNPKETAEQKAIRELTEKFNQLQKEKDIEKLKNSTFIKADELKVPKFIAERMIDENEEKTFANLTEVAKILSESVTIQKVEDNKKFARQTILPPPAGTETNANNNIQGKTAEETAKNLFKDIKY